MTMTAQEEKERNARSAKLLLLFAMGSMTMMFAGIVSAVVVSKSREDWMKDFQLPNAFYFSTLVIILCSITFHLAKKAIQKDNRLLTTNYLLLTLVLGISFMFCQFKGFGQLMDSGYFFNFASYSRINWISCDRCRYCNWSDCHGFCGSLSSK